MLTDHTHDVGMHTLIIKRETHRLEFIGFNSAKRSLVSMSSRDEICHRRFLSLSHVSVPEKCRDEATKEARRESNSLDVEKRLAVCLLT